MKRPHLSAAGGGGGGVPVSFQEPTTARLNDYKYKSLHAASKHRDGERFGMGGVTAFLTQCLEFSKA